MRKLSWQILRLHSGQCGNCQGKARSGVGNCCGYCPTLLVRPLGEVVFSWQPQYISEIFEQNVVFVHAKCVTKLAQGRRCLWPDRDIAMPGHHVPWPDRNTKLAGPPCLWPDRDFNFAGPPCLWPDQNIKSPDPRCLWPDRYIKVAGPPCLWPDRETNLRAPRRTSLPMAGPATRFGTYKVTEWRKGCSRRKHGYRKNLEAALFSLFLSH